MTIPLNSTMGFRSDVLFPLHSYFTNQQSTINNHQSTSASPMSREDNSTTGP